MAVAELEPLDDITHRPGDRSYRIGAPPPAPAEELVVTEPVGLGIRPLREAEIEEA